LNSKPGALTLQGLHTILIANRGEIAMRVVRTVKALGLRAVTVYSDADADWPHARAGDVSVPLGGSTAAESYLDIGKIIDAAQRAGAVAVHPGYGFLSESAPFAQACADAGLCFIGPSPHAIRAMGDKAEAKRLMMAAGVPCIPGYDGADQAEAVFVREAARLGYPVMLKATGGGGGKGMRLVHSPEALAEGIARARSEAVKSFGNGHLMIEKAVLAPRHIEVQVFADAHGQVVYLGDRDCSIQRRHQKIIEEAPAPGLSADLRRRLGEASVQAARSVDYLGAGTVEFLLTGRGDFYFLEMNTRLQVEHPVTELVTGQDLVAWQIAVAAGEPLPLKQEQIRIEGHAIEARLYAEDPEAGFLPQSGRIIDWQPPSGEGVRVDHGLCAGAVVSTFYDPMIAKVIGSGRDRAEATRRLVQALETFGVCGLRHNRRFLVEVLSARAFRDSHPSTAFLDDHSFVSVLPGKPQAADLAIAAFLLHQRASAPHSPDLRGWRSRPWLHEAITIDANGDACTLQLEHRSEGQCSVEVDGVKVALVCLQAGAASRLRVDGLEESVQVAWDGATLHLTRRGVTLVAHERRADTTASRETNDSVALAPMPGSIAAVRAQVGDTVVKGQTLLVLEAMKMEHSIVAPVSGTVAALPVAVGQQVNMRQVLVEIGPAPVAG
jgi:geranyl-CoA carboxylase alpha subunit